VDLGDLGVLAGRAFLLGLGGFLLVAAGLQLRQVVRDLWLRWSGLRVQAMVCDVSRELVAGEAHQREWVHVRFSTTDGDLLDGVRLRHWSRVAPRTGARIGISYRADDPGDADRALLGPALGRLLVVVPLTAGCGVLVAGAAFGLWDHWLVGR
jgi:hypothetical protein